MNRFLNNSCNMNLKMFFVTLALIAGLTSTTLAQKKNFTMAEAVNGMSSKFAVSNLKQLQWTGNADYYAYVVSNDSEKKVMIVNPENHIPKELTNLDQLNKALDKKDVKKLTGIPAISFLNNQSFYFNTDNKMVECSMLEDKLKITNVTELPEDADPISVDTFTMKMAYVSKDNLYIKSKGNKPLQLTKDGSYHIVYGDSIHRNEFGIDDAIFWSPRGNYLAFYRQDQSMVEDYPIVNWVDVPATVKNIKYPFAGRTSHQVTIGVYDYATGKLIYLKTGEPKDQYLTTVTWSPDEKYIYVSLLNREQNHLWMNRYDAHTGELVKTLFEEKNDKYVEPQHVLYFPTEDPNQFIWWSQRDGYMHLYLYVNDKEVAQLTSGNWVVNEILGYNRKANEIIFTSSKESPMQKNVYGVKLDTKEMRRFSTSFATHTAQLSHSGVWLIDNFTSRDIPRAIDVCNLYTKDDKRLLTAANTLLDYNTARTEQINLHTEDGTVLYGKLVYPTDFDSTKNIRQLFISIMVPMCN
ncbi:prolyl tripeptidyl peptidase [Filimonas sp.]|nr:prolyl tripeptidyl peptidase [Filimonas sp.]